MECKCVGRGVDTRSCGGVGDAVERSGGGGAAENVAPLSGGPLLTLERELVSAESAFPRRPRLVGAWEAVLVGSCLGKLPAARREPVAMAASHLLSIGSDALTDFLCASSNRFTYSGTRGSSAHQPRVAERRETMSVASRPPLLPLRRVKKSWSGTLL